MRHYLYREMSLFEHEYLASDDQNAVSSLELMEKAALGIVGVIDERYGFEGKKFVILAGSGNNGGDAIAVARLLHSKKPLQILLYLFGEGKTPEHAEQLRKLPVSGRDSLVVVKFESTDTLLADIANADIVIDGIFGIGVKGGLASEYRVLFGAINKVTDGRKKGPVRIAIDVPSGLAGEFRNEFLRADLVIFLHAPKYEAFLPANRTSFHEYTVIPIGFPAIPDRYCADSQLPARVDIDDPLFQSIWKTRSIFSQKGLNGRVLVVGGSAGMAGAGITAARAAFRSGAGYVYGSFDSSIAACSKTTCPELITIGQDEGEIGTLVEKFAPVLLIGPGYGPDKKRFWRIVESCAPSVSGLVIDGDGLRHIASDLERWLRLVARLPDLQVILTPHPGEWRALEEAYDREFGGNQEESPVSPVLCATSLLAHFPNGVIVLKNHVSHAVATKGIRFNRGCYSGFAKAGTGDFFAGLTAGLLAQSYTPFDAATAALSIMDRLAERYRKAGFSWAAVTQEDHLNELKHVLPSEESWALE